MKPSNRLRKALKRRRQCRLRLPLIEQLEARQMLTADWQNPLRPLDVNNDAYLSPMDALLVINRLNDRNADWQAGARTNRLAPYHDTNGDGMSSPIDALLVINALNQRGGNPYYEHSRVEGESAGAPTGFISIPFMQLPGSASEIVELQTRMTAGGEEFNELGLFVVDTVAGHIDGVAPDASNYPELAFERAQRKSLYSNFDTARTTSNATFQGGQYLRVYVLQASSDIGEDEAHLKTWQTSDANNMRIGWEEQVSIWPNPFNVGNRGYDDVFIDVAIGTPISGNPPPVIGAIADQTIDEQTPLTVAVNVIDANHQRSEINLQMLSGPSGATFDAAKGQFSWTPQEADGPGQFEVVIGATDPEGATDTERFVINVLEANLPPVLQPQQDLQIEPGDMISFFARATDPDLPANTLTYSPANNVPAGASIDPVTGLFSWTAPTEALNDSYQFTLRVTDNGSPTLSDTESFTVTVGQCAFDEQLTGWRVTESGGSVAGRGSVIAQNCAAVLTEGDSFVVTLETSFVVPEGATELSFTYDNLNFDSTDDDFINDVFEVALLDQNGNSLVETYSQNRDAFFNVSEDVGIKAGSGVTIDANTITLDTRTILPGQSATLKFRLANDDSDKTTTVRITEFEFGSVALSAPSSVPFDPPKFSTNNQIFRLGTSESAVNRNGPVTISEGTVHIPPSVGEQSSFSPVVERNISEFPTNGSSDNVMMTPVVIDLDGDGSPEIIFNTFETFPNGGDGSNNTLRAISGSDGSEVWSMFDDRYEVEALAGIAAGDIDLDGFPEIIAVHQATDGLIAFEHDGTFKWLSAPISQGQFSWGSPSIADIDQDGIPEIIHGDTVLNNDGVVRWVGRDNGGIGFGSNVRGPLSVIADIDLDGSPEIVAGRSAYRSDGKLFWNANIADGFPAIGQFDDDPFAEIVVVGSSSVSLLDHLGNVIWGPRSIPGGGHSGAPTIADMDGDGKPEIGVAGANNYVVFESDGSVKWTQRTTDISSGLTGSSVFDFDGDGRAEVVYGDERFFRIYDGRDGTILFELAKTSGTTYELPIIVDVDDDGQAEIVTTANGVNNGIYIIGGGDQDWIGTRSIWNQHSYHITNINDDGTIPQFEANSWEVYNNYRRNLQPTGTQLGRPLITVNSPASQFEAGTQVVLSGIATAQGQRSSGQANGIATVFVNDRPVDVLDVAANFFVAVDIQPGVNEFRFTATDDVGQQIEAVLNLTGTVRPQGSIDFSQFTDTTGSFSGVYGRTSFNEDERNLYVDLSTRNDGVFESDVPLLVGVRNISDPTVSVFNPDGFMPDGTPYFDFTDVVDGGILESDETSGPLTIAFNNRLKNQFDYDLVFFGKLNEAPVITTIPKLEAPYDRQYIYDVDATDADGDTLEYSLSVSPIGMHIAKTDGMITWAPTIDDLGLHDVTVRVDDGRGGTATQRYTIAVNEAPPNRPPVITSKPVTETTIGEQTQIGEPVVVDLSTWSVVQYDLNEQGPANWTLENNNTVARQNNNSDASILLSDFTLENDRIEGTWKVDTSSDDDYMGFVFGYQDDQHYYLFDWKQSNQNYHLGFAERGMSVKVVNAETPLDGRDFWPTTGNGDRVRPLFHNTIGWQDRTEYTFKLDFQPGEFIITISQAEVVLETIVLNDSTYTTGGFGFYNYSQGPVVYSGFVRQEFAEPTYAYDVAAIDPDNDTLTYALTTAPANMRVISSTGLISWGPTADQIGDHNVTVEVSDGNGGIAIQEFVVCVHPDPENHPPTIISKPITEVISPTLVNTTPIQYESEWNYKVVAFDAEPGFQSPDFDDSGFSLGRGGFGSGGSCTLNQIAKKTTWPTNSDILLRRQIELPAGSRSLAIRGAIDNDIQIFVNGVEVSQGVQTNEGCAERNEFSVVAPDSALVTGVNTIAVRARDRGAESYVDVVVSVDAPSSGITQTGTTGTDYQYQVVAIDPDEDTLRYVIDGGPPGMVINAASGLITWPIPLDTEETFPVIVRTEDGRGGVDVQSFDIVVSTIGAGTIRGRKSNSESLVGLADWTIYLDQNQNGIRDIGERFTITDVNGDYEFTGLAEGTYFVTEEAQAGWSAISEETILVTLQEESTELDFDELETNEMLRGFPVSTQRGDLYASQGVRFESVNLPNTISVGQVVELSDRVSEFLAIRASFSISQPNYIAPSADEFRDALISFDSPVTHFSITTDAAPEGADTVRLLGLRRDDANPDQFIVTHVVNGLDNAVSSPGNRLELHDPNGIEFVAFQITTQGEGFDNLIFTSMAEEIANFTNEKIVDINNRRPAILSVPGPTATIFESYRYDASAIDPDNDPQTFSLPLHPEGMTIHPTLGTIVWVPKEEQVGTHNVLLQVDDGRGGVATESFSIVVSLPNSLPVFTSTNASSATAGKSFSYSLNAQDADGDNVTFSLENAIEGMSISNHEIRNSLNEVVTVQHSFVWDVPVAQAGKDVEVTIVADDGQGGQTRQNWTLHIQSADSANTAPVISSSPQATGRLGLEYTYMVDASDADGDPLTYSLTTAPTGMSISPTGLVTWQVPGDAPRAVPLEILVQDGRGKEATQKFDLNLTSIEQNRAPAITSVPIAVAVLKWEYAYNPVAIDADGDALVWSLAAEPRGMSIDALSGKIRWNPDGQQLGTHIVAITATDPFLGQFTQRFELHVGCNNLAPAILSIPPTVALTERTYLYAVRADDFENDKLTWKLGDNSPVGMSINPETGVIRWLPTTAQIASHEVKIEVSDGINTGTQNYTVVVSNSDDRVDPDDPGKGTKGNRAPIFTSSPVFNAEVGSVYQYQVTAVDPDGDTYTLSLPQDAPARMAIQDGLITWTPAKEDVGERVINVQATDKHGATSTQGFLLSVTENSPPKIQPDPIETAISGAVYRYTVRAIDPDGDPLTYRLADGAPDGMTIDRFGRIIWQSQTTDTDPQPVTVTVSDNRGQSDSRSWTIIMSADTIAPNVSITVTAGNNSTVGDTQVDFESTYTVRVGATDNIGVENVTLLVDGTAVSLNASGQATLSATALGAVSLVAKATDAAGLEGTAQTTVTVVDRAGSNPPQTDDPNLPDNPGGDPTDNQPPIVQITSPAIGDSVTNVVSIMGTVDDPEDNLWYYRVVYSRADRVSLTSIDLADSDWVQIKQSNTEVIDGEIAKFDPSGLGNDAYVIAVAAYDTNGRGYVQPTLVNVEGNVQVGNFQLSFTDLSIPLAGIPIQVTRSYDTLNASDEGDFGFGWMLGVQDARILEVGALGSGGVFSGGNDQFIPDKTKVYLTNPSGQRVGFTYKERLSSASFFGSVYTPYFEPDPGVYDRLSIDETQVGRGGILGVFGSGINPNVYTLTTKDGLRYRYGQTDGLRTITDLNNNVVTFSKDGIKHSSGTSIKFSRDHRGRIKEIVDPAGNSLVYQYDVGGDLVRATNQLGLATRYEYLDTPAHYLDAAYDSSDKRVLKAIYEPNTATRLLEFKGIFDASGNQVDRRDFDTENNTGIVRDGNGNQTKLIYNDRGNVLQEVDPLGNTTFREYEDPNNPDLETRIIDRRGFITDREYDGRGNVMKIIERGSDSQPLNPPVVTQFSYDSGNRVSSITNALNATTGFKYDAKGNLTLITNALGDKSSFTYDSQGRRETFTDFNGNTTTFDYTAACPCGSPSKAIFADGTYQKFDYNRFGQVISEATYEADDTLVEIRETDYDKSGRVVEERSGVAGDVKHPQTTVHRFYDGQLLDWEIIVNPESLDANNNILESPATPVADRKSRITDYEYDINDRLVKQTDALGGVVEFRYDKSGNRVLLQDPVGNITTWVYDTLNRVSEEHDPFYNENLSIDQALVELTVASGASCATNTAAEHVRLTCYDAEGNQSQTIDRNARRREFDYDHAGRLEEERWYAADTDELVQSSNFTYDVLGNMLTAVDPNSSYLHTYDILNRLTSVDNNPNEDRDVPRVILTYKYDAQGNVKRAQDDAGVTVESEYDSRNRLAVRKWFDAKVPDGETADVDNARVDFFYNAAGRESEVRRYSDLDALAESLVGRTDRTYDTAGRSDLLTHVNAVDELLAGYDYDYDFSGLLIHEARTHQDAQYEQTIDYEYDLTGQLTFADFDTQDDETYTYDANGNRLTSKVGDDERTYTTDTANQLASDGIYRYEYDGEGNQIKRVDLTSGETRTFIYDHHNRFIQVHDWSSDPGYPNSPTGGAIRIQSVEYSYDALRRRIAREVDADGVSPQPREREFFVYNSENIWVDFNQSGIPIARYLNGNRIDEILARSISENSNSTAWNLNDHLRSARDLADKLGMHVDHISFSAFGNVGEGIESRFAFSGREFDPAIQMTFYRSRVLDVHTARFSSEDTLGFESGDLNRFRFVFNSPNAFTDPTGEVALAILTAYFIVPGIVVGGIIGSTLDYDCPGVTPTGDQIISTIAGAAAGGFGGILSGTFAILALAAGPAGAFLLGSAASAGGTALSFYSYRPDELCGYFNDIGAYQE